jgi:hypothetical protein
MASFENSAFLRRLQQSTNRPVPGQIHVSRQTSADEIKETPGIKASSDKISSSNMSVKFTAPSSADGNATASTASSSVAASAAAAVAPAGKYVSSYKFSQFEKLLGMDSVDLGSLRKLGWNGIPPKFRPDVWQMLLGYLPTNKDRRSIALTRKRKEYFDSIAMYFHVTDLDRTKQDEDNLSQILIDLPRTSPNVAFFQQPGVQKAMERILYIWSIRHPASGYVQGMNDLLTPLLVVSLQPFAEDPLRCDVAALEAGVLVSVIAMLILLVPAVSYCLTSYSSIFPGVLYVLISNFIFCFLLYNLRKRHFLRQTWKPTRTGASRSCWTTSKTTTPSDSRVCSA